MTKSTRRALLSSVVALVLCLTMLIGTTFAWFTDTATTAVNTIQSGTLDVDIGKYVDEEWVSLEGETLDFVKAEGHENEEILWEPGCVYNLEEVVIRNNGNLALKYKVVISGINGDAKLNEAIEWTINGADDENRLSPGEKATLTISGHMKEDAGNEYQGLSIDGIAITVVATQATVEYDSNDNQYDKDATLPSIWDGTTTAPEKDDEIGVYYITSAEEFAWLMDDANHGTANHSKFNNDKFVLDCDIDFGGATISGVGSYNMQVSFTFDGNGHSISNFTINANDEAHSEGDEFRYAGLFQQFAGGTIKNLTVRNATIFGDQMVGVIVSSVDGNGTVENCKVYDSVVNGAKKVAAVAGYVAGAGCTVNDCYAENCVVNASNANENQSGEVIGYTGANATVNNTYNNVTVNRNATAGMYGTSEAVANALKATTKTIDITLTNDVAINIADLGQITGGSGQYKLGGADTTKINIDLNGHKLTLNTTYLSALGAKNNDCVITVKNGSMNSVGNSANTWNAYDLTFYDCDWNFEDVTFDKAVAIATGANVTMTNVIINESNSAAAAYALWITAEGQTVTLNNVTIKSNGGHDTRAIAIKDEYVSSLAKVTLNITGSKISSAKKAAVLVTSNAGAAITAIDVDISGVAADSTNLVWIDNGANYGNMSEITVVGCTAIIEPQGLPII